MNRFFAFLLFLMPVFATAQVNNIVKGGGVFYTNGTPTVVIDPLFHAELAIDTSAGIWWEYSRDLPGWLAAGFRVQKLAGSSPPSGAPIDKESEVQLNDADSLYRWRAGAWRHLNKAGAGVTDLSFSGASSPVTLNSSTGTDVTITQGAGISLSATGSNITITNSAPDQTVTITNGGGVTVSGTYPNFTLTATDQSATNEAWTIDGDDADTELISNQTVKFQGAGIAVTDYNPTTDVLLITATEVDGSVSNELQTFSNTSDATSHTTTLSNSGGSTQFVEGTGIALATTGTTLNGILTITNSAPDQTVTITNGGGITVSGTYPNFTLTATDQSTTNESLTINDGTDSENLGGQTLNVSATGIASVDYVPGTNTLTIGAVETDGSVTNEAWTITDGTDSELISNQTVTFTGSGGAVVTYNPATNTLTINAGSSSGGDNWGTQVVQHGTTLTGNGTTGNELDVATDGITANEIASGAVGTSEVADNSLTATDLAVNVVSSVDGVTNDGGNIDLIAGSGISITPDDGANTITIANTGDLSATNEAWTIDGDDADTELISNQTVKFQGAGIAVTDYNPTTDVLLITATEVDGSVSNELQTFSNTSDATSHTTTLSNSGGSTQFVEGTGIALATTGTTLNGILTITNSAPDQTVTITNGGGITVSGTYPNFTLTATDQSATNEAWTIDGDDADTELISNQTVKFQGAGIAVTDYNPTTDVLLITATEVDGSVSNELQTFSNTSDATSHTTTLSNSGGSTQFVEGTGIALATTGTTLNGILTITNSAPDQTVTITNGGGITVSGTYPNFTLTATDQSTTNEALTVSDGIDSETLGGQTLTFAGTGAATVDYNPATNTLTVNATAGAPAGADFQVQYYNGGAFGAENTFHYIPSTNSLMVGNSATPGATINARGQSTTTGKAFLAENSNADDIFHVNNSGHVQFGNNESLPRIYQTATIGGSVNYTALGLTFEGALDATSGQDIFGFFHTGAIPASGSYRVVRQGGTFAPTSGTASYFGVTSSPTINQTGTASGSTTGFDASPTLTAVLGGWTSYLTNVNSGTNIFAFRATGSAPSEFGGTVKIGSVSGITPTTIIGRDGSGIVGGLTLGAGISITSGTLNIDGNAAVNLPETQIAVGDASNQLSSSANLTYDGDFLYVAGDIDIERINAAIVVDDIAASGASQGGTIYLNSKDGTALSNNDRIGGASFIGSTGVSGTSTGAMIDVYADGAWSGTESPGKISISTTPDASLTPVERLRIRESGNIEFLSAKEWRFYDSDNTNFIAFVAGSMSADRTFTWPTDAPSNGEQLTYNTGNTLSWEPAGSGGGGSFYQTFRDDGSDMTQRAAANFESTSDITFTLVDDGAGETEINADIPAGAVDLSEIANVSTSILLGNSNVAPGPPLEISLSSQLEINGVTLRLAQNGATSGQVMTWNGSAWSPANSGGSLVDSTWIKYNGAYTNKRATDNVFRYATTSLRSNDTSGIFNIYAQNHPKAAVYTRYSNATSNGFLFFQLDPDGQTNNSSVGNFNFWGTNFDGVNSPYSTRANHVWRSGYNTGAGGQRIISTDADIHQAFESNYYRNVAGGRVKRIWEYHIQSEDTLNVVHRPISLGGAHDGTVGDIGFSTDLISLNTYAGTSKGWISFKFGQYQKGLTFLDTAILQFKYPQVGVDFVRTRNAANTADLSVFQMDASNRLVINSGGNDIYTYANNVIFNTIGTITTADANPVQIGNSSLKSFLSIYAPSTEVLRLRSNTGGADLWQSYVNADNFVFSKPDAAAYLTVYENAPSAIFANSRWGWGASPGVRFHIRQDGFGSGNGIGLTNSDASFSYYNSVDASGRSIWYNSSAAVRLILDQSGKLAVGTSNPVSQLDVKGGATIGSTYAGTNAAPTDGAIIQGDVGIGNNSPGARLHITTASAVTTAIQRLQNTSVDADIFVTNATPESAITGNPGDIALRTDAGNGKLYVKGSGTGNTGWVELAATGGGGGGSTDLAFSGASSPVTLTSSTGTDVTITAGTGISLSATSSNLTISPGNDLAALEALSTNGMIARTGTETFAVRTITAGTGISVSNGDGVSGNPTITNTGDTDGSDDALNTETYVTMSNTSGLSNERALTAGINMTRTDGGANSSVTLDVMSGISTPSQFTSDQDNFTDADWSTRTWYRFSSDNGIRAVTSLTALAANTVRRITNVGKFPIYFPPEHPDGTASNRIAGSVDILLMPGETIEFIYDGTSSRWRALGSITSETMLGTKFRGQYYAQMPGSTNQSDHPFLGLTTAGTGAGNQNNPADDSPSLPQSWGLLTGTTATGSQTIFIPKNNNSFAAFGSGHLCGWAGIYVPTLSTSLQRYTAQLSLTGSANGSTLAVNNSVGIRYSDNVNAGEWEVFTRNNAGSETTGDSNIAVAANTVYTCVVCTDKAMSEARFYITDGTTTYQTRITGTMPNTTTLAGVRVIAIASVGTTSKQVAVTSIGGYVAHP